MNDAQTLKDALQQENQSRKGLPMDQSDFMSAAALSLTKKDIVDILNHNKADVTIETIGQIRKLAKIRLSNGLSVLPWEQLDGLEINEFDEKLYGW